MNTTSEKPVTELTLIERSSYSADDLNLMVHVCCLQGVRTMNSIDYYGMPTYRAQYYIEQELLKTTATQHGLELTREFFWHHKESNERYDYVWFMWNNVKFYTIVRENEVL